MSVQSELTSILKDNGNGPFLFIGSGISRRYAGLEDWEGLIRRFCSNIKDFEYYFSRANSDLPETASLIAKDYAEYWWISENTKTEREKFKTQVKFEESTLKISISEHVKRLSNIKFSPEFEYFDEIENLRKANIDGIITTNYDLLIETFFPDYKVYIGQEELIASTPQNICEIYKIHGCCTNPNSIVVTSRDYGEFEKNNPYLAAKLVTIFVENPVIFFGYSLNDPNVKLLLASIARGIGKRNVEKITKNLIFVQRAGKGRKYGASTAVFSLGGSDLPVTLLTTDNFSEIYKSLHEVQHKLPVRVLRRCKKQMYDLVKATNSSSHLCVIDFDQLDESSEVDFVIGVGVKDRISAQGYQAIKLIDVFKDVLQPTSAYNAESMLSSTIPSLQHLTKYIPVFKYLKTAGINSMEEYAQSQYTLKAVDQFSRKDFRNRQYIGFFRRECNKMSIQQIIENYEKPKAAILIPFIPWKDIDCEVLKAFLIENLEEIDGKVSKYSTYFRKLVCVYDAIVSDFDLTNLPS